MWGHVSRCSPGMQVVLVHRRMPHMPVAAACGGLRGGGAVTAQSDRRDPGHEWATSHPSWHMLTGTRREARSDGQH